MLAYGSGIGTLKIKVEGGGRSSKVGGFWLYKAKPTRNAIFSYEGSGSVMSSIYEA
jgi:hypothetical protein